MESRDRSRLSFSSWGEGSRARSEVSITVVLLNDTALSSRFSSSRTLPGQLCWAMAERGRFREPPGFPSVGLIGPGQQVVGELRQILFSMSEGGELDFNNGEAKIEILSELVGLHHVGQVSIGGCDHPGSQWARFLSFLS